MDIQQKVKNNIKSSFSLNSEVNNYIIDLKGYEQYLIDIDSHYHLSFINRTNMFVDSLIKSYENGQNFNQDGYYKNGIWFPPRN